MAIKPESLTAKRGQVETGSLADQLAQARLKTAISAELGISPGQSNTAFLQEVLNRAREASEKAKTANAFSDPLKDLSFGPDGKLNPETLSKMSPDVVSALQAFAQRAQEAAVPLRVTADEAIQAQQQAEAGQESQTPAPETPDVLVEMKKLFGVKIPWVLLSAEISRPEVQRDLAEFFRITRENIQFLIEARDKKRAGLSLSELEEQLTTDNGWMYMVSSDRSVVVDLEKLMPTDQIELALNRKTNVLNFNDFLTNDAAKGTSRGLKAIHDALIKGVFSKDDIADVFGKRLAEAFLAANDKRKADSQAVQKFLAEYLTPHPAAAPVTGEAQNAPIKVGNVVLSI